MPHADSAARAAYHKAYYERKKATWPTYQDRKEVLVERMRQYRKDHPERFAYDPEKQKGYSETYRTRHPERLKAQERQRRLTNPRFRISGSLRARLRQAILLRPEHGGSFVKDLGCTIEFLVDVYMPSLFSTGMSWENYGRGEGKWNIDHIMPLCVFNLEDRQHFLLACHYGNLQPMWHVDNMRKRNKVP